MRKSKTAVLEPIRTFEVQVSTHEHAPCFHFGEAGEAVLPIFFRKASYYLPSETVQAPMPTMTCRHLEKATIHLLQGHAEQALLAFKRAVASGVDPTTLVKVALACHTEGHLDEAQAALARAVRFGDRDPRGQSLARAVAIHLNYAI
jgi:hypothetical protein